MIPTPEQIQAARDDLARFERVPDDGSQREYRPVRPHSLRVALAAMDDARDNAGAAEELAREADAQRKAAEADIAALRLEHESWGAIIDGLRATVAEMRTQRDADVMTALMRQSEVFDVTFATVTRERDEARKALATEEHNHELTIARRDDAQSWADSLANQIAEAAGHEIGEHSNLNNPWDNAQDGLVKLVRERDELRAALLNERGEGEPPSEGWARNDFDRRAVGIAWYRPSNADGSPPPAGAMDYAYVLWVYREPMEPEWTWECEHADFSSRNIQGKAPTAREAMRAADTALAGAKS